MGQVEGNQSEIGKQIQRQLTLLDELINANSTANAIHRFARRHEFKIDILLQQQKILLPKR